MSNESWTIDEDFSTDPTAMGWAKDGTALDWDNTKEAIGGECETAGNPSYYKSTDSKSLDDNIEAIIQFYIDKQNNNGSGVMGFLNSSGFGANNMVIIFDGLTAYARFTYNDGSSSISPTGITLTEDTKYRAVLHYDKFIQTLYAEIYDLQNNPIGNCAIQALTGKSLTVDRIGIGGALVYGATKELELWVEDFKAFPSALDYADLYCSPYEVQDIIAMIDQTVDLSERQTRNIIKLLSMPKIDSLMSAIGYTVPFDTGDDTPPIIRSLAIRLSTYYSLKKLYTGHSPNEIKQVSELKNEVMDDMKRIAECLCADMDLLDTEGNVIEPTSVSGGVLSTSEGEEDVFDLEDVPDIYGEDASLYTQDGG